MYHYSQPQREKSVEHGVAFPEPTSWVCCRHLEVPPDAEVVISTEPRLTLTQTQQWLAEGENLAEIARSIRRSSARRSRAFCGAANHPDVSLLHTNVSSSLLIVFGCSLLATHTLPQASLCILNSSAASRARVTVQMYMMCSPLPPVAANLRRPAQSPSRRGVTTLRKGLHTQVELMLPQRPRASPRPQLERLLARRRTHWNAKLNFCCVLSCSTRTVLRLSLENYAKTITYSDSKKLYTINLWIVDILLYKREKRKRRRGLA